MHALEFAPGKQRLIDAALRLAAEKRSFSSLGIRELARAAGLNPNTFYRHFETLDDLGLATVALIGERLRPMLRHERWAAARDEPGSVARRASQAFFDFTLGHPDAFLVGVTVFHGPSPRLRDAVAGVLENVAAEMADDVLRLQLVPVLPGRTLDAVCRHIVDHLFHMSIDYIERPYCRGELALAAERFIIWLFAGAAAVP